jgi:non-homologous end joining protein Ku
MPWRGSRRTREEPENVALEPTRTIEIDEFVDGTEIDPRYLIRPYYLRPDGKVAHDAFVVIRETIRETDKVGRVVLTSREHIDMPTCTEGVCSQGYFGSPVSGSSGPAYQKSVP